MTSARQIEANRENSTKSTGPVTDIGKQSSALNSFKHGLTAQTLMLQPHEREAHTRMSENMNEDYRPKTEAERQLVLKIVDCHTRLNRISALDNNILNLSMLEHIRTEDGQSAEFEIAIAQAKAWIERAPELDRLSRYGARISRQLMQYTRELSRIQKERRALSNERFLASKASNKPAYVGASAAAGSRDVVQSKNTGGQLASFGQPVSGQSVKAEKPLPIIARHSVNATKAA